MLREFYRIEDIAARLRLAQSTIRHAIKTGKLRAVKAGKQWRITESDLDAYLQPSVPEEKEVQ
jgi:excisionase family DNA binding protein